VFLIAGASSGIGAATARQAAEAGYRLVLAARSEDKLAALVEELGGADRARAVRCDVAEFADQQALVREALDAFGRLDVVFANAGVGHPRGFEAGQAEDAKQMILTNVYGVYTTIRASAAALRETQGHVVITFNVHRNGAITDIEVKGPSGVDAFDRAAVNALLTSNPTQQLPADYPSDSAFFTVTFLYNEEPPPSYYRQ